MLHFIRVTRVRIVLALIVILVIVGVIVARGAQNAHGASRSTVAGAVGAQVSLLLPGSSTSLVPDTVIPGGVDLSVVTPASTLSVPGTAFTDLAAPSTQTSTSVSYGELGWKAAVAAGAAGILDPSIVGYRVSVAGVTPTGGDSNYLSGPIRSMPGGTERSPFSMIGSVSLGLLTQQVNSNIATLAGMLGAGAMVASHVVTVPVDPAAGAYALEVDVKVSSLSVLNGHVADVLDGLETGLVGDMSAPIEGMAINVVDEQGGRVSWFTAVRAGSGSAVADPPISLAQAAEETTTFPNLTGGPALTGFAPA